MAFVPPRTTFALASLGAYVGLAGNAVQVPGAGAITEIRNFSVRATAYVARAMVLDQNIQQNSTQALYDSLHLHFTVFEAALAALPLPVTLDQNEAIQAVAALRAAVTAAINAVVPGPLVLPNPAPAEAPLELILETVLNTLPVAVGAVGVTFAQGWAAVTGFNHNFNAHIDCGMPNIGFLAFGNAGNGRLVVAMNEADWARFSPMRGWSRRARVNSMPLGYRQNVAAWTTRAVERGGFAGAVPQAHDLVWQFNHPVGMAADASVVAAWNAINAALLAPVVPGPSYARAGTTSALAFSCQRNQIRTKARCRRCRIIFRYNMFVGPNAQSREPQSYDAGIYQNALTCAEVLAYEKCQQSGL